MRVRWLWLAPCLVPLWVACVGDEPATSSPDSDATTTDGGPASDAAIDTGIVNVQTTFGEQTGSAHMGVTADTEIQWGNPTLNYGAHQDIVVHGSIDAGPDTEIGLIHFDLSSLPTNSNVLEASLVLATTPSVGCALASGYNVSVYPMQQAWVAGNLDGEPGVANYTNAQASTAWNGPGVTPPSRADASTISFAPGDSGTVYQLPITALVQSWIASPTANFGVALVADNVDDEVCFVSSDNIGQADLRPLLKITLGVAK